MWLFRLYTSSILLIVSTSCVAAKDDVMPKVEAFFQGHCTDLSPCHQRCIDLPHGGFECSCDPGHILHSNGFSCIREGASEEEKAIADKDVLPPAWQQRGKNFKLNERPLKWSPSGRKLNNEPSWEELLKEEGFNTADMMLGDQASNGDESDANGNEDDDYDEVDDSEYDVIDDILDEDHDVEKRRRKDEDNYNWKSGRRRKGKGRKGKGKGKSKGKTKFDIDGTVADSVPPSPTDPGYYMEGADLTSNNLIETQMPPIRFHSCEELRCHAGGKCVPDEMRGGVRCQCRLGNTGDFCESDIVVRYPKFMGTGYMAFPALRGAYKEFKITVEFRPDTGNGLLIFSGEHPSARSDFFSVSLIDGFAEFRFDCGTGMAEVRTANQVQIGRWNTISVHRNDWNGWIQLNDGPQSKGRSKGVYTRITLREDLYLGGYRNSSSVGERTGMQWGFVGCVRYLEVNNKVYDMRKGAFVGDAIQGIDVSECSSHICEKVKCQNGGTCFADSPDTHVCLCPLGTAGDRCENKIDVHVPSFGGESYLQYIGLRRTVLSFTEIEIVFKSMTSDGMLLYNGYTTDRSGDFICIAIVNGYLEYRFDLGTGPAVIRSRQPVSLNEWHVVRVSRTGRDGYLQVDNQAAVEGMSKGAYTQLTLTLDLFVGGHRNFDEVAKNAGIRTSFKGCIQKVVINERPLKLMEESIGGNNVDNCNHPCVGQPCLNGGRCIPIRDFYKCSCPLGFENTNCEDRKARRELKEPIRVPMFSGNSYLLYTDPYIIKRVRGQKIEVHMRIKAIKPDGLIFWSGEDQMTSSSDFISIGMRGGHVFFSFNLGSGEVVISYNNSRLDDGKWHRIGVQRVDRVGYLEIDGTEVIEATSPGNLKQLNTESKLYLGGMDDVVHKSLKKYSTGFVGCIADVVFATNYQLDLIGQAYDGQNIQQCS